MAFGVIDHTRETPEVVYLDEALPVTDSLLGMAAPLQPTEVFRFGATCHTAQCAHWSGRACGLVDRIVARVPAATSTPPCRIRVDCRWFAQSGAEACARCAHVVTQDQRPTDEMREAATPAPPKRKRSLRVVPG